MNSFRLSTFDFRLVAAAALALLCATAAAQPYPSRPVRVIIPQAAGGAVDVAWRPIAQKLSEIGRAHV